MTDYTDETNLIVANINCVTKDPVIVALGKIAASNKAACLRSKEKFCIIVSV